MKNRFFWIVLLVYFAEFGFGYAQSDKPVPAAVVPDFTFFTLEGNKPFTPAQLPAKERSVFVFFDPDCHYCQDELRDIADHLSEFKGARFFLVAMQDKPIILNFMKTYGAKLTNKANVTVLHDANTEFIPKFQPSKYSKKLNYR